MSSVEARFLSPGESLVGLGFRCWLRGYRFGRDECLKHCRDCYWNALGAAARPVLEDLASWVDAVRRHSLREIELLPKNAQSFGRDECLAVTLVAASRHRACPALQICALTLMGSDRIEPALDAAYRFGQTLRGAGIELEPGALTGADGARLH